MNSGKKDKAEGKDKIGKREFTRRPPCHPWGVYAEELIPLIFVNFEKNIYENVSEKPWLPLNSDAQEKKKKKAKNMKKKKIVQNIGVSISRK